MEVISSEETEVEKELSYENRFSRERLFEFIVFLPFHTLWKRVIVLDVVVLFITYTSILFVESPAFLMENIWMISPPFDIPYFIDVLTAVLHWKFTNLSCRRIHKPRKIILIVFDFFTLIPYHLLFRKTNGVISYIVFLIPCSRIYRIIIDYIEVSSLIGLNIWSINLQKFGAVYITCIQTMALAWYLIGCPEKPQETNVTECPLNWGKSLTEKFIFFQTNGEWYYLSIYYVMVVFSTVGFGDISNSTDYERLLTVGLMMVGWFLMGIFLGNCTSIQVQNFRLHAMFSRRFKLIEIELKQQNISEDIQNRMMTFYYTFWRHREATRSSTLHEHLPTPLKTEVDFDTYYEALNHSHMFSLLPLASKQALASVMQTEIFMPGEVLLHRGAAKTAMIYISSGTINILSATDDETPIMSLSSGTLLGEINLVLSCPSAVQIEAATYTEIQYLEQKKMLNLVNNYPDVGKRAREIFETKLKHAKSSVLRKETYSVIEDSRVLQNLKRAIRRNNNEKLIAKPSIWFLDEELDEALVCNTEEEVKHVYSYIDDNLDLYVMSRGIESKLEDDVCLKTKCPWVFNPNNDFLFLWDCVVTLIILIVCIMFPYYIGFETGIPAAAISFEWGVFIVYAMDIYFQLSTAMEKRGVIETKLKVIISKKIASLVMIINFLATIPFELVVIIIEGYQHVQIINILKLNRVFRAFKIIFFFKKLEENVKINAGVLRMCKSLLCLTIGAFWMGTVFYMLACDYKSCSHESWMACVIIDDSWDFEQSLEVSRHRYEALLSLYTALQMIGGTGLGDVVPRTYLEITVVIFFLILGSFLIVYLIADYSAMLILESKNRMQFKELVLMMQKFLENSEMPIPFQRRVYDYLALQWTYRDAFYMLYDKVVYFDAPERLIHAVEISRRGEMLRKIPFLQDAKQDFINKLSVMANSHILPPNEMVIYAGDMCHEFYMLEEGYCEEIAGATGDVLRILTPPTEFCCTEMLFSIYVVNSVRTVTHCKLSRLTYSQIFNALLDYPELERDINRTVKSIRNSNLLSQLTEAEAVLTMHEEQKQDKSSWFTYTRSSKKFKNTDYMSPFLDLGNFHFIRFLLLNRTILPYGMFLKWYEGIRSIIAFISAILFPAVTHLGVASPWLTYVCPVLDIFAAFDMKDNIFRYIVQMNRVLQARRIPTIFSHMETSLLAHTQVLKFLKYVPLSIVLTNTLSSLLIGFSITYRTGKPPLINPNSWLAAEDAEIQGKKQPFEIHIRALVAMGGCSTSIGTGMIVAHSAVEMTFIMLAIISGYLLYTFVTVKISSSKVNDNINLTSYQERMKHLIRFMNTEGLTTKELKQQIINHFEHIWKRTRGVQASKIIGKFYNALKRDAVLHLFEETLMKVPTFAGLGRSFYQRLGVILVEDYYIKGAYILKENDVIQDIYIVDKGEVLVVAGDGTQITTLTPGSMFGNIFNCPASRCLLTFIANKHVDILITSTAQFYLLVQDFHILKSRFEKSYENYIGYLQRLDDLGGDDLPGLLKKTEIIKKKSKKRIAVETFLTGNTLHRYCSVFLLFCGLISCISITYQVAFEPENLIYLCTTGILEVIFILKIFAGFYMPYQDETGEIITNRKLIGRRYFRRIKGFWLDLTSALPLDFVILIVMQEKSKWIYAAYARCIQMVRMIYIFLYFNLKNERLNVNMILQKTFSTIIYFILFTHCAACVWYIIGKHDPYRRTWVYQNNTVINTKNAFIFQYSAPYGLSFYYVCALMSTVGSSEVTPATTAESIFTLTVVFFSKPITALFIGEISATIASSTYTLVNMEYYTQILKSYMKNNQVSPPLIKKVISYVKMLWVVKRGLQVPDFLKAAPKYLMEEFKVTAYGVHIYEAVIFKDCHNDFLRQLIAYIKRYTFFPGNFIAYEGEVNNTMYFIHHGTVEAVRREGTYEYLHDILHEEDIFGITQGLYKGKAHIYTFKAVTVSVILALKFTDWEHLCTFFPSAKEKIYEEHEKLQLSGKII